MRIRAFHIDGFGILNNVEVDRLPSGLSVFLGNNEAGKSTCLEFFRTMLTGYPLLRSRDGKKGWTVTGHKQGGSLMLDLEDGRALRLSRQPGPNGGSLSLFDSNGKQVDLAEYDRLLGGVSRDVYRSIYGFSLSELQTLASLENEAVRNALYGAGFGLGLNTPGLALAKIQNAMDAIFKPRGKNQPLNAALHEWDELKQDLREAEAEAAHFDTLANELNLAKKKISDQQKEKLALEHERRGLDRRLGVWKLWEEWKLAQARMDRLETVPDTFPLDGIARLDRLLDRREAAQRQTALFRDRVDRLKTSLASLEGDLRFVPLAQRVKDLTERKASCRNALIAMPTLRTNLQRAEEVLLRQLASLGPDWDMDRIRRTDRSLFVREELERRSSAMKGAESNIIAMTVTLERASHDAEQAKAAAELARQNLNALPEPAAELDPATRDALHSQVLRLEDCRQRLPEREKALAASRAEYSRTLSYLHLRPDTSHSLLMALAEAQEQALLLADEVRKNSDAAANAGREAQSARKEEEAVAERLQRIQTQERDLTGTNREDLDNKRTILRRLRKTAALLDQEDERLLDLTDRYSTQEASLPRSKIHVPLLVCGLLLGLTGGVTLLARFAFGLEAIDLTAWWNGSFAETPPPAWLGQISLVLWVGYLLLFVGVIMISRGWPHASPDKARSESQLDQLKSRRDTSSSKLEELKAEIAALCESIGLDNAGQTAIDNLELQLDRERERWATNERLQQEKAMLQSELDIKRRQLQAREAEHLAAENAVQAARRRWHDYLIRLGVRDVPLPEVAAAYFARVESTCIAHAATANMEEEIRDLKCSGSEFVKKASELLPDSVLQEKFRPSSRPYGSAGWSPEEVNAMVEAVRTILDSCRQTDVMAEEKTRAAEALRSAEASALRLAESCISAEQALREAMSGKSILIAQWKDYLGSLGLDLNLSPVTTREALDCMERCLNAEAECNRLKEEIALQERERDALALPLTEMLDFLEMLPHLGLDREPDWLGTLDIIQREVDKSLRRMQEKAGLEAQLREQEDELRITKAAENDANKAVEELLSLAGVNEPEHFRRKASVLEERNSLTKRQQDLEDALSLVAGDTPLSIFLEEFSHLEKPSLDAHGLEVNRRLEALREEEQKQAVEVATLDARLQELAASDRLAQLRMQEAALEEEVRRLSHEWSRHALARQLLLDARRSFEEERQPEVVRTASSIFSTITGGNWPTIAASLEDSSLLLIPTHGEPVAPELLSRGAQEQLYLALRLAHIRSQAGRSAILPVIMDDIMVNFDPERMEKTIVALADLITPKDDYPGNQILFFTCHPYVADMMMAKVPDSSLFTVQSGQIAKSR